jgi:Fe-S-cluster containining protein
MIRCLSVHASYVCAHTGACCRAGWSIPVEEALIGPLRGIGIGIDIGAARVAPVLPSGECAFFEADAGRLCRIHRRGGPRLLPSMCRHFPRVVVNDPRGTSVTLSHFCPTAAALLFSAPRLAIVDAPASLALEGSLEGLDATGVLPPLLTAELLTDWEGYSAWEAEAVALFDIDHFEPECAVEALTIATEASCSWRPGREPLTGAVRDAFAQSRATVTRDGDRWGNCGRTVNAFLAAHAFASWAAYEPDGLRAIPAAVAEALAILRRHLKGHELTEETLTDAIRATDLQLRHAEGSRESRLSGSTGEERKRETF